MAQLIEAARAAAAEVPKPAQDVFWGGRVGCFADPEGHVREVAWTPFLLLSPAGEFRWAGY